MSIKSIDFIANELIPGKNENVWIKYKTKRWSMFFVSTTHSIVWAAVNDVLVKNVWNE